MTQPYYRTRDFMEVVLTRRGEISVFIEVKWVCILSGEAPETLKQLS